MANAQAGNQARGGLMQIPGMRSLILLVAIAAAVAAGVAVVLWSQKPPYSLLMGNLSDSDMAQVVQGLQSANIPYELSNNGSNILVPADQLHSARLKMASQGLPENHDAGFEMIQGEQGFGVSQFIQNARYHHALEVELARTINSLQPVKAARVHLALPKQSVFVRDSQKPSASVLLDLYSGRSLDPDQIASVVNLVASSVPNMDADQVTVIDQQGHLLNAPNRSKNLALSASQFEYQRRVEDSYGERIVELLTPIMGAGRVHAQVVADMDFSVKEQTRESYAPDSKQLRSEQVSESIRPNGSAPSGVPGALSNQPPDTGGAGPQQAAAAQGANGQAAKAQSKPPEDISRDATRNYELDRTVSHTKEPTGAIRRLSVAVILDDKPVRDDKGKLSSRPLTKDELSRMTSLIKNAVGFDAARGDSVNVMNSAFEAANSATGVDAAGPEPMAWWKRPWVHDLLRQGGAVLMVLVLLLGVLRPLFRNLTQMRTIQMPAQLPAGGGETADEVADDRVSLGRGQQRQALPGRNYEDNIAVAKQMVNEDPKRVAQVVKNWVREDG